MRTVMLRLAAAAAALCAGPAAPAEDASAKADAVPKVDASTMNRKLLMGYQGWFACPRDGSRVNGWVHWFREGKADPEHATVDFWPDTSELEPDELFPTDMTLPDGKPAMLYSAFNQKTVVRHFQWMQKNGLDGVMVQRFLSELSGPMFEFRNKVTENARAGAEKYGRVFTIMYDISGQRESSLVERLKKDWAYLVDTMKITESSRYLKHKGKPVLAIWGFGFEDRAGTPAQAREVIRWFKSEAEAKYRVTLMGGVPTAWRTLGFDSQKDPAWADVYRSFDVISPWAVGRYGDEAGADGFRDAWIAPDLRETKARGIDYMPVIFPGFSWHNLKKDSPLNPMPRRGGRFYWRQAYNAIDAKCTMLYGAMFDEVDEGTAMYKLAPTKAQLPQQGTYVPLDIDGEAVPSDWYLRLAGEATKALHGTAKPSPKMPLALPKSPATGGRR